MKIKLLHALFVTLIFLLAVATWKFSGVQSSNKVSVIGEISYEVNNAPEGILFSVSEVSAEEGTCTLLNENDALVVGYSSFWAIQAKFGEKWYAIVEKEREPEVTYIFPMEIGEEVTVTYKWATRYGTLPRGHYRIVRVVYCGAFPHETPYRLAVEFDIE